MDFITREITPEKAISKLRDTMMGIKLTLSS